MDPLAGLTGSRRNEDIALDMMKFIASTTNFGKTAATSAGFHGGAENKSEDYATPPAGAIYSLPGNRQRQEIAKHKFALEAEIQG